MSIIEYFLLAFLGFCAGMSVLCFSVIVRRLFLSEDRTKQYMFYCNNSACDHYRIADPRTDYVDALKRWNELTVLRYDKK